MQPTRKWELTEQEFLLLKRTMKLNVEARRRRLASGDALPQVLGIKLTNRCNLRCKHCYQWNEDGYHHDMPRDEQSLDLPLELFQHLLDATQTIKSRLYLWGGEPLFHREIAGIFEALSKDMRDTTICTNAHYLDKYMEQLCGISESLDLLIPVEGFEGQHDAIRGKGSFGKVMKNIETLCTLRDTGDYKGKISVHTVINDTIINRLYELLEMFESKGVDLVILCFPWYIAEETSKEMDFFVDEHFRWLIPENKGHQTWDAFKYRISPLYVDSLMADLRRINGRAWKIRVRYQPGLEFDEIEPFVRGKAMAARCASQCTVLNTRVDISPTGNVSACKFFSEFSVGNLHETSLGDLWMSETYDRIRGILGESLSPACSKCNVLYLQEHSMPIDI